MKEYRSQIDQLEFGEKELSRLTAAVAEHRAAFIDAAQKLHGARKAAAETLDTAIWKKTNGVSTGLIASSSWLPPTPAVRPDR